MLFTALYFANGPASGPVDQLVWSDRFDYEVVLGSGGYGTVWKAYDKWLGLSVAVKISRSSLRQEVGVLRTLPRTAFVNVFDYIRENGLEAYSMELLSDPWITCSEFLERSAGEPPIRRAKTALLVGTQLLLALDALHGRRYEREGRWCHGDVKPGNIWVNIDTLNVKMIDWDAQGPSAIKLGDLGLVAAQGEEFAGGTAAFRSPEHETGRACAGSDVFSVGQTLMCMLTGSSLGTARTHLERIKNQLDTIPSTYLKTSIADIVRKMTYRAPSQRPSASKAAGVIGGILRDQRQWAVIEVLASEGGSGLKLGEAADILFPRFAESLSWINRTEDRLQEIKDFIKRMRKNGILEMAGHRYRI